MKKVIIFVSVMGLLLNMSSAVDLFGILRRSRLVLPPGIRTRIDIDPTRFFNEPEVVRRLSVIGRPIFIGPQLPLQEFDDEPDNPSLFGQFPRK